MSTLGRPKEHNITPADVAKLRRLPERLTWDEIAAHLGCSRATVLRVWQRRTGRALLPKGAAKSRICPVRLTHTDWQRVARRARAEGKTVSDWVRGVVATAVAAHEL